MTNTVSESRQVLSGKEIANKIRDNVRKFLDNKGLRPQIKAIIVGDDYGAQSYAKSKRKKAEKFGIELQIKKYDETITTDELIAEIESFNKDNECNGVIIERPLPKEIDFDRVIEALSPHKDIDCATATNLGMVMQHKALWHPATAEAVCRFFDYYGISLDGARVAIIGRSITVGLPLANMLLSRSTNRNATVTVCHSHTQDIEKQTSLADVLVVSIGQAGFVDESFISPGCVVIDVGINYSNGTMVGDVDYESASRIAKHMTPVPGGVGPVTVSVLFENAAKAAALQNSIEIVSL